MINVQEELLDSSGETLEMLERILTSAQHQLESLGVDGMTVRSIAKEAGVSTTTLYNRFGGKDNIVSLVVSRNFYTHIDIQWNESNKRLKPLNQIFRLIELEKQAVLSKPKLAFALAEMYFKQSNERQLPDLTSKMLRERILPILEQMAEQKEIAGWVDLPVLANDLVDRVLSTTVMFSKGEIEESALGDYLSRAVLSALIGYTEGTLFNDVKRNLKRLTKKLKSQF